MMNYKKLFKALLTLFGLFNSLIAFGQVTDKKPFVWGINGHPLTQEAYNKRTWDDQLSYLSDLQVKYYRIDVPLNKLGISRNEQALLPFVRRLKSIQVKPMLVLSPRLDIPMVDSASFYQTYYDQGKRLATRYGAFMELVEVGNEWDVQLVKNRKVDGTKITHYDLPKARQRMILLQAFIDGMKSVLPDLQVSISLCWMHWYYLSLLQQFRVDYDIIGYHWYSDMGDITQVRKPYGDFLPAIKKRYQKVIWITEFNTQAGTKKQSFEAQQRYILRSLERILQHGVIEGVFMYELFDQPALAEKYPAEPNYGLVYKEAGQYRLKPAYATFKQYIEKRP